MRQLVHELVKPAGRRVLITGATGHVGAPLLRRLVEAGADVRAAIRHPDRVAVPGVEAVAFDVTDPVNFAAVLQGFGQCS